MYAAGNMNLHRKRPIGVTLIALAFLWVGIGCAVFFPFLGLTGGGYDLWHFDLARVFHSEAEIKRIAHMIDVADYVSYIAFAVIGFGLWKLKNWARISMIALEIIAFIGAVTLLFVFQKPLSESLPNLGLSLVQSGWMIWYFMRPGVRNAFGAWKRHAPDGEWIQPPTLSTRGKFGMGILFVSTVVVAALL